MGRAVTIYKPRELVILQTLKTAFLFCFVFPNSVWIDEKKIVTKYIVYIQDFFPRRLNVASIAVNFSDALFWPF